VLVCGGIEYEDKPMSPLLAALPPLIHLRRAPGRSETWLDLTLAFLTEEAQCPRPGSQTTATRLAELVFTELLRTYFSTSATPGGLVAAFRDPHIARAIASMHRQPELKWDLQRLARHSAMSRTAFAASFKSLIGESPMSYLTRVRMTKAAVLLTSAQTAVTDIAHRVGYDSVASFNRAFKRASGKSPLAYRKTETGAFPVSE